jgi:osmotically-inducible protein OsmY
VDERETIINEVLASLERESRIHFHQYPITVEFEAGILTLTGTAPTIAAKKLALEAAAAISPVTGIVDRLKVAPAEEMADDEVLAHIGDALLQEPALTNCAVRFRKEENLEVVRETGEGSDGAIEVAVQNGDVLLEGQVPSLSHKRLAGVLAWWVPGTQNVLNCLIVEPPEQDNDDELTDAVRLVLEKDPFVNAGQIKVSSRNREVTLEGLVAKPLNSEVAEADAWYVFGVDRVINKLQLQ